MQPASAAVAKVMIAARDHDAFGISARCLAVGLSHRDTETQRRRDEFLWPTMSAMALSQLTPQTDPAPNLREQVSPLPSQFRPVYVAVTVLFAHPLAIPPEHHRVPDPPSSSSRQHADGFALPSPPAVFRDLQTARNDSRAHRQTRQHILTRRQVSRRSLRPLFRRAVSCRTTSTQGRLQRMAPCSCEDSGASRLHAAQRIVGSSAEIGEQENR